MLCVASMLISFLKQQRQLSHQQVGEQTFSDVLSVQVSNFLLCHPQRISMQADCLKVAVLLLGNHKEARSELMTFIYLFIFLFQGNTLFWKLLCLSPLT